MRCGGVGNALTRRPEGNEARRVRPAGCAQQRSRRQALAAQLPGGDTEVGAAGARRQMERNGKAPSHMRIDMRQGEALRNQ